MGKHANQGAKPQPDATDPAATDTPVSQGETTSTTGSGTTSSGGMMRPNPYWGPHDDKS